MDDSLDLLNGWLARKEKTGVAVPADARPEQITLATSAEQFLTEFLKGLYVLEHAMAEKGLDPSEFTLAKRRISSGGLPGTRTDYLVYDYEVSFHGHSYLVRREGDMAFLAYFSTLTLSDEHEEFDEPQAQKKSFFLKLVEWLEADVGFSPQAE